MRAAFFAVAAAFLPIVACSDDRPAEPTNPVAISASVFGAASRGLPYQLRLGEIDAPWAVGDSRQLHVIVTFSGGSANVSGGLTWSSSNSSVLRVTSGGQATAVANGSATVSAKTPGGKHVEGTITVGAGAASGGGSSGGEPPDPGGGGGGGGGGTSGSGDSGGQQEGTTPQNTVGGVTVNPTEASLRPGDTGDLDATVWDAWGNPMSGRTPTWTSSNTNVVTVTSSGGLSAKGLGTATITAAAGSHSAQANITVSQSTVAPSPQGGAPQGGTPQGSTPPPPPSGSSGGSFEPGGMSFSSQQSFSSLEGNGWYSLHFGLLSASGGVLQMAFPAHTVAPNNSFTPGAIYYPRTAGQTVYMRARLRLSDNFQGNPSCAQKLFEWFLGFHQRVLLSLCGAGGSSFRLDAFGRNDSRFAMNRSNPTFTRGAWHTVEAVASLNSAPGVPDGTFAYYLDGQVAAYYTNVVWIFAGEDMMQWTEFKVDPVWGGLGGTIQSDQYLWIDDIYVSGR